MGAGRGGRVGVAGWGGGYEGKCNNFGVKRAGAPGPEVPCNVRKSVLHPPSSHRSSRSDSDSVRILQRSVHADIKHIAPAYVFDN